MSEPVVPLDVNEWTDDDVGEFFRMLGLKLEKPMADGYLPTITEAVYLITEDLAADTDVDFRKWLEAHDISSDFASYA